MTQYTSLALCESVCLCVSAFEGWPWVYICVYVGMCVSLYVYMYVGMFLYRGLEIGMLAFPYIQKVNKKTVGRTGSVGRLKRMGRSIGVNKRTVKTWESAAGSG